MQDADEIAANTGAGDEADHKDGFHTL